MIIKDFTNEYIEESLNILKTNYENARLYEPTLPSINKWPDLKYFAKNKLGVVAIKDNRVIGYLCCFGPFENSFGSTKARGIFSPMEGNGTIDSNKDIIYSKMYQYAAQKWIDAGVVSHAICLFSNDKIALQQFFEYGFGLRCIDAIRVMKKIEYPTCYDYKFVELNEDEFESIFCINIMLSKHLRKSPIFINRQDEKIENFKEKSIKEKSRYFVAKNNEKICAFLKIDDNGETFLTKNQKIKNITGAFCLEEHRGKGLYQNLLNASIFKLKEEGYTHLGVDFESINPVAHKFWLKYFTPYTNSVVRRIDEKILDIN